MKKSKQEIDQLSLEQKRILVAKMIEQKKNRTQLFPLSLGQERIWLHSQFNPDNPLYNIAVAYNLKGSLNVTALEKSLQEIIKRHQTLRTTFSLVDKKPVQVISFDVSDQLQIIDLQDIPERLRQDKVTQLQQEAAKTPFDLTQGLLWCIKLFRCSEEEHNLLVVMHHIISDGWSFYVFCQELQELYQAFCQGETSPLPDLARQYTDFAQRQREWLESEVAQKQMAYWKIHLGGQVPTLELPVNHSHLSRPISYQGTYQFFQFSSKLSEGLKSLSKQEGATLFMTLSASFQALLYQYTGQEDMVLCSPVASRHRSQTKELIGYFNNILPIRTDLSGNPSFLTLIGRVRQASLNAYKNQDVPFQRIINLPNLIQTSLTKVLFSVDIRWPPELALAQINSEAQSIHTEQVNFDISVSIWEESDQFKGVIEYKTDLFEHQIITQMLNDYQNLLETLMNNPELTLLSLGEQGQFTLRNSITPPDLERQTHYLSPRSVLEQQVTQIWEEVLGSSPIGVRDNLFTLGASSLAAARLCERIQDRFNVKLSLATIFQAPTVEQITDLINRNSASVSTSSLVPLQPHGNYPPLFLCSGAGIYSNLIPYLGQEQPLYGLITPRDGERSATVASVVETATHYLTEISKVQSQGPYFLGGVSFGGLVAFEMAQQLWSKGEKVALLALFDTPGPGAYRLKPLPLRMLGHLINLFNFGMPYLQTKIGSKLEKFGRNQTLPKKSQGSEFSSDMMNPQLFRQLAMGSAKEYQYKIYPGRITLFKLSQRKALTDSLFDPALGHIDSLLGWGSIATQGVESYEILGEHTTILREPYVKLLGEKLKISLQKAYTDDSSSSC